MSVVAVCAGSFSAAATRAGRAHGCGLCRDGSLAAASSPGSRSSAAVCTGMVLWQRPRRRGRAVNCGLCRGGSSAATTRAGRVRSRLPSVPGWFFGSDDGARRVAGSGGRIPVRAGIVLRRRRPGWAGWLGRAVGWLPGSALRRGRRAGRGLGRAAGFRFVPGSFFGGDDGGGSGSSAAVCAGVAFRRRRRGPSGGWVGRSGPGPRGPGLGRVSLRVAKVSGESSRIP